MSPYHLVYRKTCHLLFELEFRAHWAIKKWNMDVKTAGSNRQMPISKLEERRERAYHNAKIYKERTKRWHDKRIKAKEFTPWNKVLLFKSRVKLFGHGKLKSKWEGPFLVINTSSHGAIMIQDNDGNIFRVNGHCLQVFHEHKPPKQTCDKLEFVMNPD